MLEHINAFIAFTGVILLASLLVTLITQMIMAAFNLRGANLLWGLKRLLVQMNPGLDEVDAKKVVNHILRHPLISKWKRRLTPVIRLEEFSQLLIKTADSLKTEKSAEEEPAEPGDAEAGEERRKKNGIFRRILNWITGSKFEDLSISDGAITALENLTKMDPEALIEQLKEFERDLSSEKSHHLAMAQAVVRDKLKKARVKLVEMEYWFDKMTDRISERFTTWSKYISFGVAVVIAFVLKLDAIELLDRAYNDTEFRSRMVASSDYILNRSEEILNSESIFNQAMDKLREKYEQIPDDDVPSFSNSIDAKNWLREKLPDDDKRKEILDEYRDLVSEAAKERLGPLGSDVAEIKNKLDDVGFKAILFKGEYFDDKWNDPTRWIGIIISALLLSLGSPFWFNVLKNLTNLRTRLMQSEEKEREGRKKPKEEKE